MLLLVFSPDIIPRPTTTTTISHIIFQYYSVFYYGKKQLLLLGQALFLHCLDHHRNNIELTWTDFNLDRKTSIKVGDLRWSELQINFTDRERNIWYNEEIN